MFVADITVGTPQQTLSCLLDSGSADLWVPSKRCKDCETQHSFRADKSKTFMPAIVHTPHGDMPVPVEVDDSGGQIVGFIVQDRIGLGPWVFENQSFLIVEESHLPKHRAWDGICGLGWKGMTSSVEPLYRNLQKHHGYATFALVPSTPGQTFLVVGEVPEELHRNLAWAEAETLDRDGKRSFWAASGGVAVNGDSPVPARFIVDTGTSFVLAPRRYYTKMLRSLIPRQIFDHNCGVDPAGDNLVVCDCNALSTEVARSKLTIYLGGHHFQLPLSKLLKHVPTTDGGELCLLHLQQNSMTSVNPWDLLNALLGNELGAAPNDSAMGGPVPGKGLPPGLALPPFLMPQAGPPLPTDAEQVEEVVETRPDGQVCTTTLVWRHGHLKDNRTSCRGRRLQLQWPGMPEDEMSDMWVLGGAFLENFATVFDFENHRLGIGELANGAPPLKEALPMRSLPVQHVQHGMRTPTHLQQHRGQELRAPPPHAPPPERYQQSGNGGSGWGVLGFGTVLLSLAGCAAVLWRKTQTRKNLTNSVNMEGEEGAELWEEADAGAAVAE